MNFLKGAELYLAVMIAQRDEGFFFVCIKSAIAVQCIP
jgi:hypothetical protein